MNLAEMKRDHAEGLSPTRIGIRQGGLSAAKVRKILRRAGLEVPDRAPRQCTKKRDARIRTMLLEGRAYGVICDAVGCSNNAVAVMRRKMKNEGEL